MKNSKNLLLILFLIFFLSITNAQKRLRYIFPDPENPIYLIRQSGYNDLQTGYIIPKNNILAQNILSEFSTPFHSSLIKLNQCTRNFIFDTSGPNVLFLSNEDGGFLRHGLIIKDKNIEGRFPNLNYVDLSINDSNYPTDALAIFSHELGHVMMANIMHRLPRGKSVLQHVSMGITDYYKAFSEGWGEHFQIVAINNMPKYRNYYLGRNTYMNISLLWHSNLDDETRQNNTLQNKYIFQKLLPTNINPDTLDFEQAILLYHTSPLFNIFKLKNAQQMLSCEGMLSALFYVINSDSILQNNYIDKATCNNFLLSPLPDRIKVNDVFTPYENILLKNFLVWSKIKISEDPEKDLPITIQFIKEWCNAFPSDKERIISLFIKSTIGRTVSDKPGELYEKAAYYGITGDYKNFKRLEETYDKEIEKIIKMVLYDNNLLIANIGPELWVCNNNCLVRTTLWNDKNKKPLMININTASEYELASFQKIGRAKAKEIIKARENLGYFKSLDESKRNGFIE